jgi:hypothetical protein
MPKNALKTKKENRLGLALLVQIESKQIGIDETKKLDLRAFWV